MNEFASSFATPGFGNAVMVVSLAWMIWAHYKRPPTNGTAVVTHRPHEHFHRRHRISRGASRKVVA